MKRRGRRRTKNKKEGKTKIIKRNKNKMIITKEGEKNKHAEEKCRKMQAEGGAAGEEVQRRQAEGDAGEEEMVEFDNWWTESKVLGTSEIFQE